MAKLTSQDKALLELELIEKSKETDKFDFDLKMKSFLALYVPIFAVLLKGIADLNYWIIGITGVMFLILFFVFIFPMWAIQTEFKKKHKMFRKRYKILGINPAEMDEELREMTLP